jgi:hypothetical protein
VTDDDADNDEYLTRSTDDTTKITEGYSSEKLGNGITKFTFHPQGIRDSQI